MSARAALRGVLAASLLALTAASCTSDRTPVAPVVGGPRVDAVSTVTVFGRILGPDSATFCDWVGGPAPRAGVLFMRVSDSRMFAANVYCPADSYSVTVEPGDYVADVMPFDPKGLLAWVHAEEVSIGDTAVQVAHDFTLTLGTRLLGGATLDGQPVAGAQLFWVDGLVGHGYGASTADGSWEIVLENGRTYTFRTCGENFIGTRVRSLSPAGPVLFPTEADRFDCALETSPAAGFSHTRSRLVLTVGPGGLGYVFGWDATMSAYVPGWGLQYPVSPATGPSRDRSSNLLYRGGLLIGLPTGHLFGADAMNALSYDPGNVYVRSVSQPVIQDLGTAGKQIKWAFDDPGMPGAPGLEVAQKSWDGLGGDYVFIQYRIRNRGDQAIDIAPGMYMSYAPWGGTVGATAMGQRLYYVQTADRYVGTLLLGSPAAQTGRFWTPWGQVPWQEADSALYAPAAAPPEGSSNAMLAYVQGSGVVRVKPAQKTDLAVAVIGAHTLDELLASAAAAEAEYGKAR